MNSTKKPIDWWSGNENKSAVLVLKDFLSQFNIRQMLKKLAFKVVGFRCRNPMCFSSFRDTPNKKKPEILPIGSIYGIFCYIWLIFMVNVGRYTIHTWILWVMKFWGLKIHFAQPVTPRVSNAIRCFIVEPSSKPSAGFFYNSCRAPSITTLIRCKALGKSARRTSWLATPRASASKGNKVRCKWRALAK